MTADLVAAAPAGADAICAGGGEPLELDHAGDYRPTDGAEPCVLGCEPLLEGPTR